MSAVDLVKFLEDCDQQLEDYRLGRGLHPSLNFSDFARDAMPQLVSLFRQSSVLYLQRTEECDRLKGLLTEALSRVQEECVLPNCITCCRTRDLQARIRAALGAQIAEGPRA